MYVTTICIVYMVISNYIVVLMVISLIRNNVRSRIQDILPMGEIPYGEKILQEKIPMGNIYVH